MSKNLITCHKEKVKIIENNVTKENSEFICFFKENYTKHFVSANCREGKCLALARKKQLIAQSELYSKFGKPGFKLCKLLGGRPSLVDIHLKGRIVHADKCHFVDDSFVATDFLIREFKKTSGL